MSFEMFRQWCVHRQVTPVPALPATVAAFVEEIEYLGINKVLFIVQAISNAHAGIADPTLGPVAQKAINQIEPIKPPRSWPKDNWPKFKALPYDLQKYLADRDVEASAAIKRAFNQAAKVKLGEHGSENKAA